MYNEPEAIQQVGQGFKNIQSVAELDKQSKQLGSVPRKRKADLDKEEGLDIAARWKKGPGYVVNLDADRVSRPSRPRDHKSQKV